MDNQKYQQLLLQTYEELPASTGGRADTLFKYVLGSSLILLLGLGWYLANVQLPPNTPVRLAKKIKASFVINGKKKPVIQKKKTPPKKKVEDLTKKPLLKQKETFTARKVVRKKVVTQRRVYGLRKVFAKGLGSGGNGSAAIVSKLGNTLRKEPDTLKATIQDLKGPLVSTTTITSMPKPRSRLVAKYTQEMKENRVTGVIKAKVTVDIDGSVKNIRLQNDLGHGSAEVAREAFKKLKFAPAMKGKEPVAVEITLKCRFVLTNE